MDDTPSLDAAVLDQMADAVVYAGRDGMIRRWNRAAVALFGYTAQEALGQSVDIIVPEHLRAPHWHGFNTALASGRLKLSGHPTLTRAVHKGGDKLYVELSFALVTDQTTGDAIGAVAVARDAAAKVATLKTQRPDPQPPGSEPRAARQER